MGSHCGHKQLPARSSRGNRLAETPCVAVSFSSKDRLAVDGIERELNRLGILLTRYEANVPPQGRIDLFIESFLDFDAVLVILSQAYMESDVCVAELITLAQEPEVAYLMSSVESGYDIPCGAACGVRRLFDGGSLTWVSKLIGDRELADVLLSVAQLLSRRYAPVRSLEEPYGRKSFLAFLGFTPQAYIDRLESILSEEELVKREVGFEAFLEVSYPSDYYLYYRARSFAKAGYADLAVMLYQRVLAIAPHFIPAYLSLCRLAITTSDDGDAILRELIGAFDVDAASLSEAEQALCLHARGLVALAASRLEVGDTRLTYLREAVLLLKESADILDTDAVRNALGQAYECLGQFEKAFECYKVAFGLNDSNPKVLNNLALYLHNRLKRPDLAIPLYERALENEPAYRPAKENLALALESCDCARALELYFDIATEKYSGSIVLSNAALLLDEEFGEKKSAGAFYRVALARNPAGCAPNYNMASFCRRTGPNEDLWQGCMRHVEGIGWNELVSLERVLHGIDRKFNDMSPLCEEALVMVGDSFPWRYLLNLSLAIAGRVGNIDDNLAESNYYPCKDLAARISFGEGDGDSAEALYELAIEAAWPENLPPLSSVEDADFSPVLWAVEKDIRRMSSSRIARAQVVKIDDDTADLIHELIEGRINAGG